MMKHIGVMLAITTFLVGAPPAAAQKEKRADVSGIRLIAGPKGDRPYVPGLNAALLLTDEQKERLASARDETIGSEALLAAGRKVKTDANATEAEREAVRKSAEEAQAAFDRKVTAILTRAQRDLMLSLQAIYGQAAEAAAAEFGPRLVAAKGKQEETVRLRQEMQEWRSADVVRRVREFLTPEQLAAFDRAAQEEKQRAEAAAKSKR